MGLVGLLFILAAGITAALTYFLQGNVVWTGRAGCTQSKVCGTDGTCCPYWDSVTGDVGLCRKGAQGSPAPAAPLGPCSPKTDVLPLSLAVATVALLFTGFIVLLIPGGESAGGGVALRFG